MYKKKLKQMHFYTKELNELEQIICQPYYLLSQQIKYNDIFIFFQVSYLYSLSTRVILGYLLIGIAISKLLPRWPRPWGIILSNQSFLCMHIICTLETNLLMQTVQTRWRTQKKMPVTIFTQEKTRNIRKFKDQVSGKAICCNHIPEWDSWMK